MGFDGVWWSLMGFDGLWWGLMGFDGIDQLRNCKNSNLIMLFINDGFGWDLLVWKWMFVIESFHKATRVNFLTHLSILPGNARSDGEIHFLYHFSPHFLTNHRTVQPSSATSMAPNKRRSGPVIFCYFSHQTHKTVTEKEESSLRTRNPTPHKT